LKNRPCRGAQNPLEQQRQLQKLTAALSAIDADILALVELENNPEQSLRDVVSALNSVTGKEAWAYVPSGSIGQDVIKVGLVFKRATVTMEGRSAILNRAVDGRFNDALNRPALAQTFRLQGSGALLTVVATHLKSKNCADAHGPDADQNDGQACFSRARAEAAAALADWAVSDPTDSGASQVLILGDFNSYRMEDPIRAIQENILVDLLARFEGADAYTYVYDGLAGTLDYAFGNEELAMNVTGVTVWHINADESAALDYRSEPDKPMAYLARNPFRSSDHDPVIIGLNLGSAEASIEHSYPEEDSSTLGYTWLAGALLLLLLGALSARNAAKFD
jgi:predicted extracellular nuclease